MRSVSGSGVRSRAAFVALGLALVAVAVVLASCGGAEDTRPNIVLVILDTVRDDYVGVDVPDYPGEPLTPWFDRVASEGTDFTHAYANAPWTVPSHASLLTGEFPSTHQCTGFNW
ncbi:MAG: sulfatase-like hydrolase/transferase, partial [Candidatus Eisenbacteria bacterium]|nr:sulfatase-like hydrolase/transferase [Candidatus Eisenbacteria bacterium]